MKFKVGDKVVVIEKDIGTKQVSAGDKATILEYDESEREYTIKMDKDGGKWYARENWLKLTDVKQEVNYTRAHADQTAVCTFITIGNVTIAVPKDTPIGIAIRNPDDENNKEVGQGLALLRMFGEANTKGLL